MIYSLYGQPGSGKTTLGRLLAEALDTPFIIDGDEFREMFANKNYGREGREENLKNSNVVATYLNKKNFGIEQVGKVIKLITEECRGESYPVVLSMVNPYKHLRDELKQNNKGQVLEILLTSTRELRKEYHVKDFEKGKPDHTINTDKDAEETWKRLDNLLIL